MEDRGKCLRCGGRMRYLGTNRLQMGSYHWLTGHLGHLLNGTLDVAIVCCERCHKLEFYLADELEADRDEDEDRIAQVPCPYCGAMHDLDDPKCPFCGKRLQDQKR